MTNKAWWIKPVQYSGRRTSRRHCSGDGGGNDDADDDDDDADDNRDSGEGCCNEEGGCANLLALLCSQPSSVSPVHRFVCMKRVTAYPVWLEVVRMLGLDDARVDSV